MLRQRKCLESLEPPMRIRTTECTGTHRRFGLTSWAITRWYGRAHTFIIGAVFGSSRVFWHESATIVVFCRHLCVKLLARTATEPLARRFAGGAARTRGRGRVAITGCHRPAVISGQPAQMVVAALPGRAGDSSRPAISAGRPWRGQDSLKRQTAPPVAGTRRFVVGCLQGRRLRRPGCLALEEGEDRLRELVGLG